MPTRCSGKGVPQGPLEPQSKSSAEVQVAPGTGCRHPEPGRVRKSRVPWGHRAHKDTCPGDKQGDVDAPVPAVGRAPRRDEAWPPQGAQEAQGLTVAAFSAKLAGHELLGARKAGLQPQHKRAKEEPPLGHPHGFLGLSLALPSRP